SVAMLPFTVLRSRSALRSPVNSAITLPFTVEKVMSLVASERPTRALTDPFVVSAFTGPPSLDTSTPPCTVCAATPPVVPSPNPAPFTVVTSTLTPLGTSTRNSTDTSLSLSRQRPRDRVPYRWSSQDVLSNQSAHTITSASPDPVFFTSK